MDAAIRAQLAAIQNSDQAVQGEAYSALMKATDQCSRAGCNRPFGLGNEEAGCNRPYTDGSLGAFRLSFVDCETPGIGLMASALRRAIVQLPAARCS